MKGIELSERYFNKYGRPMLEREFPDYLDRIAVGLVGEGSECFGFDDAVSQDHDYEPGFCLWLTEEDEAKIGFSLMAAYEQLPKEYHGVALKQKSRGAAQRRGVFTINEFYKTLIGKDKAPSDWREWFYIPQYALANAVNGKVFEDRLGVFSSVRAKLIQGYPRDVKLKKLSAHLALMAQSGQYNFSRCVKHGEVGAAHLALYEFINHTFFAYFLLNDRYTPFYKWRFRALSQLDGGQEICRRLDRLLESSSIEEKQGLIDLICGQMVQDLKHKGLTASNALFLETQALEVSSQIRDPEIKSLHLMEHGES